MLIDKWHSLQITLRGLRNICYVVFAHALLIHADIPISEIRSTDIAKWINLLHDIGKSKRFTDIGNSNLRYQMIIPISVNTNDFPIYDNWLTDIGK